MRLSRRTGFALFAPVLLALSTIPSACGPSDSAPGAAQKPTLRVSVIPTTDPGKIARESQPLVDYLQEKTGAKVDLSVPTNYAAVVEAIANDQVDCAFLGGFTYVQASKRAGVLPLVQREQDQNFHSVFITQTGSPIQSLGDLAGHSFAFGDVNSTSGHLMPEYFMRQASVDPKVIEAATYTGGHDTTALAVANGKVDAGAMDELVFQRMTKEGKLDASKVRIFYTTPPFFDYVWVARKGLDRKLADDFAAAFLALDPSDPKHKQILDALTATKYVRADDASYAALREAATSAGLLK